MANIACALLNRGHALLVAAVNLMHPASVPHQDPDDQCTQTHRDGENRNQEGQCVGFHDDNLVSAAKYAQDAVDLGPVPVGEVAGDRTDHGG